MSFEFDIDGAVDLGSGYRLIAGGFRGSGSATEPSDYAPQATRSTTTQHLLTEELAAALDHAEMREEQAIYLRLIPEPGGQRSRSARQEDAVILEAPDLGDGRGQVVMLTDEDGGVSFHYPVESEGEQQVQTPTVRGSGGTKVFVIPADVPSGEPTDVGTRGLVGLVAGKLLQVLTFPAARAIGSRIGEPLTRRWEEANRPYGISWFGPEDFRGPSRRPVGDWSSLHENRSLLFVHGTFSTAIGGFGGIPTPVMQDLWDRYHGRVIAFDHHSLSSDPVDNCRWFLEQVPTGVSLNLDVVAHSRGGLVARALAGAIPDSGLDLSRVHVNTVVCAATPNYGTPLADAQNISSLCDRMATASNLIPGMPCAEIIDAVLLLVQLVAQAMLGGLRGLEAMRPQSDFLDALNGSAGVGDTRYFGIAADFEPMERGLARVVKGLKDQAMDFVFQGVQNDLVVPTLGVSSGASRFGIEMADVVSLDSSRGVMHNTLWKEPEIASAFATWLPGDDKL